jgi:HEAT repeat protein
MSDSRTGVFTADTMLAVQSWDSWMESATGIRESDARGRQLPELFPDLEQRALLRRFQETLASGAVQVFTPAFHQWVFPCPPRQPSRHFDRMQQRVTVAPLLEGTTIAGVIVTVQDVTPELERERELAEALVSDDPERRRTAAEAVAAAGRVESFDLFAPALADDDWRVRRDAVGALGRAADRDLLDAVIATLKREHRDFSTLSSAVKLLTVTDLDVTDSLVRLLHDDDADLRLQAALALGEQHDAAAVEALIEALGDPEPNVRFHAIESLGRLRADTAVDALTEIVESRDFFVSFAALEALALINDARVAPRLVPLLQDAVLRPAVADALRALADDRVVAPLVDVLNTMPDAALEVIPALVSIDQRHEKYARAAGHVAATVSAMISEAGRAAARASADRAEGDALPAVVRFLGWLRADPLAMQRLVAALGSPAVRAEAIDSLVRHGEAAVDLLVQSLAADDADVRNAAITALARLGDRRATTPLLELLPEPGHTVPVAAALAAIGDPAAFEPLLERVGHPDAAVRQAVIGALNSIGHPAMPERIATLLHSSDAFVRESAVRIAGYFGYPDAIDGVIAATADSSEAVRVAALEHLPFSENPRVLPVLLRSLREDSPRGRAAAAKALGRVEDGTVIAALDEATRDSDPWVRYFAARSLGEQRAAGAVGALAALSESDPLPHVRIAALDSLGLIGDRSSGELLALCATDDDGDVAGAALYALGRLSTAEALTAIREAARAPERSRRAAAVRALQVHDSSESIAELVRLAEQDPDAGVSAGATEALSVIAAADGGNSGAAVDALTALCADQSTAEAAAAAINRLPPVRVPDVARALSHPHPGVRRRVVTALGQFADSSATASIVGALGDADAAVRETAVAALVRLGVRVADDQLRRLADSDPSKAVRRAAAAAVASMRRPG